MEGLGWFLPLAALAAAGLFAGFCAGMFGIGGGFVVVPAMLMVLPMLGGHPAEYAHVAVGTSAATIIVASARSVAAHAQRGAVDFAILRSWAPWLVLGDAAGVVLAGYIDGRGLLLIFASGVALMSLLFLTPHLSERTISEEMPTGFSRIAIAGGLGTFSSLLGIGGGTIAITVMTLCSRTIHRAIATASGIGIFIAVPTAIGFALIGFGRPGLPWGSVGFVNVPAAVVISSMSVLTAPLGVAAAHGLPAAPLKRVFGAYLVIISLFMFRTALRI
ncbi:MAG TPA: sulfite exporter TauE/SafE family protein [Caulobacteraceae bacterium]|jgi:uncharacterized membrane protein YfcA|nr:sulfite exporter TauE/SafE family protein [Caulobacteraceae bacterium]